MSVTFQIEDGVPLPKARGGGRPECGVPKTLRSLRVGQSVVIPASSRAAVYKVARQSGAAFITRRLDSERLRVWRSA